MTRRHPLAAALATLGLVAASVFAAALPAQAAPNSITIDQVSGPALFYGPLTGSLDLGGDNGVVYVDVTNSSGTTRFCDSSSYAYFDTTWECAVTLGYGDNQIVATAVQDIDPGNPISTAPIVITYGSTAPVTLDTPFDGEVVSTLTPTFSGNGPRMGTVSIQARPAGSGDPFATVCGPLAIGEDGIFSCPASFANEGDYEVQGVGTLVNGLAATPSPVRALSIALPAAPPPPPPSAPRPPAATPDVPPDWSFDVDDLSNLRPGDVVTVTVTGVPAEWIVTVMLHSTPRLLGSAASTGEPLQLAVEIPADVEPGDHRLEVVVNDPGGAEDAQSRDARILPALEVETEPDEEPQGVAVPVARGAGAGDRGDPAASSALTDSIATLERIVANPIAIAVAGGLALAILFLVALPTELLNSSLSSNTSRLGRWYGAVDGALTKAQDWFIRVTRSRALAAGLLTVAVAVIYGFVDPDFGVDLVSLRLVLALGIAFFLLSYGASWVSGLIIRRLWGIASAVGIQPAIVLFAIVGVVLSRLLDFSPGFLVGIAIGLELLSATRRLAARAVLVQFLVVVGLALAAWVAYSLFTPGDHFAGMLVDESLAAITAEGLTGALVAVLPLQFLDGRELWLESKRLWVAAFLLVAVPFALLVLPTAAEGTRVGDYGAWLIVFAAFAVVTLAVWALFARAAQRDEAAESDAIAEVERSDA